MVKAKQEPQPGLNFFFFSFPQLLFSPSAACVAMPRAAGESRGDVSYTEMNSLRAGQLTQFPHRAQSPCSCVCIRGRHRMLVGVRKGLRDDKSKGLTRWASVCQPPASMPGLGQAPFWRSFSMFTVVTGQH